MKILLHKLKKQNPRNLKQIKVKEETLTVAEKLLNNRQQVIDAFKAGIFPYKDRFPTEEKPEEKSEEESEEE